MITVVAARGYRKHKKWRVNRCFDGHRILVGVPRGASLASPSNRGIGYFSVEDPRPSFGTNIEGKVYAVFRDAGPLYRYH